MQSTFALVYSLGYILRTIWMLFMHLLDWITFIKKYQYHLATWLIWVRNTKGYHFEITNILILYRPKKEQHFIWQWVNSPNGYKQSRACQNHGLYCYWHYRMQNDCDDLLECLFVSFKRLETLRLCNNRTSTPLSTRQLSKINTSNASCANMPKYRSSFSMFTHHML